MTGDIDSDGDVTEDREGETDERVIECVVVSMFSYISNSRNF